MSSESSQDNTTTASVLREDKFKAFHLVASSRRTLYVMGTTALIFVIGLSIGLASSQTATTSNGHGGGGGVLQQQKEEGGEPYFNPYVAVEGYDNEGQTSKVKRQSRESFSLEEIVNNVYSAESWNGTWVSDSEYAYRNLEGGLALLNVVTGQSRTIVPSRAMNSPARVFRFWVSADLNFVLLASRPQKLFRHSFIAAYDIYEISTGERTKLQPPDSVLRKLRPQGGPGGPGGGGGGGGPPPGPPGGGGGRRPPPQLPLMFAEWAPTGSGIAYVFANNIYYRSSPKADDVTISESGIPGTIFNGICDWVYEEEVFSDTKAMYFSPDGTHLAWVEFNDTEVDVMPLQVYGQPGRIEFQYPIPTPLRYPKPGRTNPFVNAFVTRLDRLRRGSPTPLLLAPPKYFDDKERLIYSVTWATNEELSLTWETRHQNYSLVSICDTLANCRDSLVMTENDGWMDLDHVPIFTKDGRQFAMILSSENYKHVNVINRDTNQRVPITTGDMVVTNIYFWDEEDNKIYFRATRVGGPGERHLYTVTDFESGRPGIVDCLSCSVTNTRGGYCGYNMFEFSKEKSFYTMSCQGPHVPQDYLYRTSPNEKVGTLVTNEALSAELASKNLPKISNFDVDIDNGRFKAKVRLYLPHDFNENKKYPLLVNVYAGPNSQQVSDRFKLDWGTYLTTSEDIIYAVIDGRGSGFRGDDLLYEIHYKLGQPEVQDQLDVTKDLINRYNFIDKSNVAIWGWSYGGFVTLSALAADAVQDNVFKCGVAVAPVTNWIYYDTIYTERYMGLPTADDNLDGYRISDVTSQARRLKNKKLLMVHGTADDNVHYQQSMMMARALEEADVLFQQLSYPDENHGLVGLRPHFYHSLSNFILNDCFGRNEVFKK